MDGALLRYRIMSFVVGTALCILVFVAVPLRYAAGEPLLEKIVGPLHGLLYIVYLITVFDLAIRARLRLLTIAGMILSGFIPLLAFFMEHRINLRLRSSLR